MKIRPDRQEWIFLGHLALVTVLFYLARGSSQVAEFAAGTLGVLTYPLNLLLTHESLIPVTPPDPMLDRPGIAYAIAAAVVPFLVINSYLWAFVICHIKWQWRVGQTNHSENMQPIGNRFR